MRIASWDFARMGAPFFSLTDEGRRTASAVAGLNPPINIPPFDLGFVNFQK